MSGTSTNFGDGLDIVGDVLAASGTITLTGTDDATNTNNRDVFLNNATLGSKTATNVTSSTANVVVRGNRPAFGSNVAVNTSGTFTLEPEDDGFTSAVTVSNLTLDAAVSGLTIGKSTNTADLTIANAISIDGPVTLHGGNVAINGALSATDGQSTPTLSNINIHASGAVTQTAAITADGLGLHGTGTFTLTNTGNSVTTLAGGDSTTKLGSLDFVNAGSLEVGSVNPTGITATGDVFIATVTGDLTVSENIATDSTSASAIVVAAGTSASAGTDGTPASGNVLIFGTPTLSVGTGGTISLYTGDVDGSTGLTALVGSGTGRFRYNTSIDSSGAATAGYTTALATDVVNALYRQQPSVSGTLESKTVTYGDTTPSFSVSGGTDTKNGDSAMVVVQSPSNSTSGSLAAGTYGVAENSLAGLGYDVGSITNGQLIVNAKALTVSGLTSADKVYDGTTAATVSGTASLANFVAAGTGTGSDGAAYTGDTVSLTGTAVGTFNDKDVADATTVSFSGLSLTGADAANYTLTAHADASHSITAKSLTISGLASADKVYDGTTSATVSGTASLASFIAAGTGTSSDGAAYTGDAVGLTGAAVGAFNDKDVADATTVSFSGLTLTGADAGNYTLTAHADASHSITARTLELTFTGNDKVYDGDVSASVNVADDRIEGDVLTLTPTASFVDKNVGDDKAVSISNVGLGGADASNYTIDATTASTTAAITRLNSVTWTGGAAGNWFDPSNWGGAVPDLSNVGNVVIPDGVTVTFDTSGAVGLADVSSAVNVEGVGLAGSLIQNNGSLNVGNDGIALNALTQNGGSLNNTGPTSLTTYGQIGGSFTGTTITADRFQQSAGSTSLTGNLTVDEEFSQTGDGTITVGGNASITDTDGGMVLGNLAATGTLDATSTAGAITQAASTTIAVDGATTLEASDGDDPATDYDVTPDGADNDFVGTVPATGKDVTLADTNALTAVLTASGDSTVTAGGNLAVSGSTQGLTTTTTDGGTTSFDSNANWRSRSGRVGATASQRTA